MRSVIAGLLLFAFSPTGLNETQKMRFESATRQMAACGFPKVQLSSDEVFQDVLEVSAVEKATDAQLTCAAKIAASMAYFLDMPRDLQERYGAIFLPIQEDHHRTASRIWLAERGLLAKLPMYRKGTDKSFAKQIEKLCGALADGAFQSENGPLALNPNWIKRELTSLDHFESLECLTRSLAAAGYQIGFLGNETLKVPD